MSDHTLTRQDSAMLAPDEAQVWRKVVRRTLPLLMMCYLMAYLDRVNVSIARLEMSADLSFSDTVYGIGAGIFFIGFFLFQIPSNMMLHRLGARRLLGGLLISWALIAPLTAFVKTPAEFYTVRLLLGVAESGFYPGVIFYLAQWFPSYRRGRMFALFAAAVPIAGIIGAPLSGIIMTVFHNRQGLEGWQWLYIIEGVPSLFIGFAVIFLLTDRIDQAHWLSTHEKTFLSQRIAEDVRNTRQRHLPLRGVFLSPRVWLLTFIYFCLIAGFYTVSFWMPILIHNAGASSVLGVGMLTAIPYAAAIVTMLLASRSADKRRERRWHLAAITILSGAGMMIAAIFSHNLVLTMVGLTLGTAGSMSSLPLFWSLPTMFLGGAAAAVGIAIISAFGNLAGFVAPWVMGALSDLTHSTLVGMLVISSTLFIGAAVIFFIPAKTVNH